MDKLIQCVFPPAYIILAPIKVMLSKNLLKRKVQEL